MVFDTHPAWLLLGLFTMASQAFAAEGEFKTLSSAQITAAVSGKYVTDDHHWGHHYLPDGRAAREPA